MTISIDQARALAQGYTAAWNTGLPEAVAAFYAPEGVIVINAGDPWTGHGGVANMAAGFYADVPDLSLVCDGVRFSGDHVLYLWTFTGTHAVTGNPLRVSGWEEWDLDVDLKVAFSRGWFDAEDYGRQTTLQSG